jgi:hypothetical protein
MGTIIQSSGREESAPALRPLKRTTTTTDPATLSAAKKNPTRLAVSTPFRYAPGKKTR